MVTIVLGGGAWWVAGDPIRALAVLVVATPCPLILAAPVALICGVSRAARRGIIVKGGGVLERLARARSVLFDKTGTLTTGTPRVTGVETLEGRDADEVLQHAASLAQVSQHVVAGAIVAAARSLALPLALPRDVEEIPGGGLAGRVGDVRVLVGSAALLKQPVFPHRPKALPHAWQRPPPRLLGWHLTAASPAPCCSRTGSGRRRHVRCGPYAPLGWSGS